MGWMSEFVAATPLLRVVQGKNKVDMIQVLVHDSLMLGGMYGGMSAAMAMNKPAPVTVPPGMAPPLPPSLRPPKSQNIQCFFPDPLKNQ